ncbi:thioredoxin family protein [Solitalea canadensis]|uniref:Protein containing a thioredoxin domain n=1 Tax=Solitalea canadensis (strain ATCC 29591 / DSM 3403 / JCM 21819 / LMG 8368 / NBRC 15130 / NCIMB 12057 / USAM 9D) TaxID=929556 RepID=H8KX95_SOLCM|nr:thioredoxin domain-containing protein [Solitalea canadensis]AFD08424.1 protein containing a thioredoxin domain [Solitalea canadensis DSM 3403]
MNKFLLSAAIGCSISLGAFAQTREINFKHDAPFKEVLAEAKKQHKLIFFDAYTSWCGPCKVMANTVFKTDSVADFFNQTFVNLKVDMEKGEGPALQQRFGVSAYPTLLFIDGDGNLVHKMVGSAPVKEFMAEARKALDPEKTVFGLAKKFNAGDHSDATCIAYMTALEAAYENDKMGVVAKVYFDKLPEATLIESKNWDMAKRFLMDPSSKAFAYLFNHSKELGTAYGTGEVDMYYNQVFGTTIYALKRAYGKKENVDVFKDRIAAIEKLLPNESFKASTRLLLNLHLTQFAGTKQWDNYCALIDKIIQEETPETRKSNPSTLLWAGMEMVKEAPASYCTKVLAWAAHYEQQENDLYTQIMISDLHKMVSKKQGKKEEAQVFAAKSESLRKQAAQKGSMTPQLMKD